MKRFFYTIAGLLLAGSLSAQLDARATVKSLDLTVQAFIKASTTVSYPNPNNQFQAIFAVSLPANGSTNTGDAPVPVTTTTPVTGVAITALPVQIINDRFIYTRIIAGNAVPSMTWPANSENLVLEMTFGASVTGDKPRLDNLLNTGGSGFDYFYFEVNGTQRSDTEGDPFYDGVEGSYGLDVYVEAIAALPITLVSFNAEKFNDRSSLISWSTSSEINSSHFNVQRSLDNKTWVNIGRVAAQGNSQLIQNYQFIDQNVYNGLASRLTAYYRLQSVDIDDKSALSSIKSVVFTGAGTTTGRDIVVYPNPSSEGLQVEWDGSRSDQPTQLEFFDTHGKLVYSTDVDENASQQYIDFDDTTIIPGLYILRIMSGDQPIDFKQIVVDQR